MRRLLVTGASGYIGQRLCELAADDGAEITVLGSAPTTRRVARVFVWHLGDDVPPEAFDGVAAVVHLAHSWHDDIEHHASPANINFSGTEKLARAAFAAGVPRFVFASTTSARPQALNAYGQVKFLLEERLLGLPEAAGRVTCARIGLVYGGREAGLYGLTSKLARVTPILPMIGLDRKVQPIYLDEVAAGLFALAINPARSHGGAAAAISVLAGPEPVTFGTWLRILRRAHTGKRLVLFPIPVWTALMACDFSSFIPFVPTINRERVLGLLGTAPMESASDLAAIGIKIIPPTERLKKLRSERRRIIAEATAMLAYVSRDPAPPKAAVGRLIRAFDRQGAQSLGLPRLVIKCPSLLRVFEPLPTTTEHRLAMRLHLAVMVTESMQEVKRRPSISSIFVDLCLDAITAPFRLVLQRRFA